MRPGRIRFYKEIGLTKPERFRWEQEETEKTESFQELAMNHGLQLGGTV